MMKAIGALSALGLAAGDPSNPDLLIKEALPRALLANDECDVNENGACAVNALQLRGLRGETSHAHPVVDLELYRITARKNVDDELSNVDMFSLVGLLHYLHTKVVWEHEGDWTGTLDPRLESRAQDVDTLLMVDAHVRNPSSVIDEVGSVGNFVDFGTLAAFVDGMATGPGYNWDYGDIVGVAGLRDRSYASYHPYYQFSLSGGCPNLLTPDKDESRANETGTCMKYSNRYNLPTGKVLRGGLCPNGTQAGVLPTGHAGCAYTYTPPQKNNIVNLDDLVGITNQSCGGGERSCKDWQDWRMHCDDHRFKVKFNYMDRSHRVQAAKASGGSRRRSHSSRRRRRHHSALLQADALSSDLIETNVCVEYDIHKDCAKDCNSQACQRIPMHKREVGLPFWRGRCDPLWNAQRAEMLATKMNVTQSSGTHSLLRSQKYATCLSSEAESICRPNPITGGMYCSRAWAGVCQPCYIPGAVEAYPENASTPVCPWDILKTGVDYVSAKFHPECASHQPRDLCCLYSGTCDEETMADAMEIGKNTTEDGYAFASSLQSTEAMMAFMWRAVNERFNASLFGLEKAPNLTYWQWGLSPLPGASLEKALAQVETLLNSANLVTA